MATGTKRHGGKVGGRQKGTPNVITKELKEMILEALNHGPQGGVTWLVEQRDKNPNMFGTLIGKILPLQVSNAPGETFRTETSIPEADKELLERYGIKTK